MTWIGVLRIEKPLASKALRFGFMVALMALILLLAARPAHAATFNVTNTNDSGSGSLRQAIEDANNNAGSDTINISATGTINLQNPLPNLNTSMEINGPGASQLTVRRDQGGDYRIFSIFNQNVTIKGLTISNGRDSFGGAGIGVNSVATLNLNSSVVSGNTVSGNTSTVSNGGGIANFGTPTLINSTVSGNTVSGHTTSTFGGGVYNAGTATLTNSTVSGNTATGSSGTGGIHTSALTLTLTNSTLNNNSAPAGGGVANFYRESGSATFKNTIVANPQGGGDNCAPIDPVAQGSFHLHHSGASEGKLHRLDVQDGHSEPGCAPGKTQEVHSQGRRSRGRRRTRRQGLGEQRADPGLRQILQDKRQIKATGSTFHSAENE